ncbi:MAG: ROK family protein [Candidatus Aenigmarchaeota archaeon]|nr:ROK family protein [Candidatus Aenigmarchaeota archaeon]
MYKVALVVGGTSIACALFRGNKIIRKIERKTHIEKGKEFIIKLIIEMIEEVRGNKKISGIGLGSPGTIDRKKGIIFDSSNIPWKNVPLKKIIQKMFKVSVFLENDANCAALGILKKEKVKNFVLLTLGTGLGGAIVIDGKLYTGIGNAGEFGHSTIKMDGMKCKICGNRGCLEGYVSGRAFKRLSKKYFGKKLSPLELGKIARKDNKKAKRIYEEVGKCLGVGLANITNTLNPEIIFLTGKIIKSSSLFLKITEEEMKKRIIMEPPKLKIVKEDVELYGAASLGDL